ncbi:hypothetical protein FB446DRAFT_795933 [Lentinula raphanica]|nr:hypothetical protein FB446DRAFT_795933 [Lentinula raphanica]
MSGVQCGTVLTLVRQVMHPPLTVGGGTPVRSHPTAVAGSGIAPPLAPGLVMSLTVMLVPLPAPNADLALPRHVTYADHALIMGGAVIVFMLIVIQLPPLVQPHRRPSLILVISLGLLVAPPLGLTATMGLAVTAPAHAVVPHILTVADTTLAAVRGRLLLVSTALVPVPVAGAAPVIGNAPTLAHAAAVVLGLIAGQRTIPISGSVDVLPEVAAALRNGWSSHIAMGWFNPALALRAKRRLDGSEARSAKNLCAFDLSRISSEDFTEIAKAMPLAVEAYLIPAKESAPGSGQALRMAEFIRQTFAMVIAQRNFRDQFPTWREYTQDVLYEWYLHPGQEGSPFVLDESRYRILWERALCPPVAVSSSLSSFPSGSRSGSSNSLTSGSRSAKPRSSGFPSAAPSAVDDGCFLCAESSHTTRGHFLKPSDLLKRSADNRNWVDKEGNIICNAFNRRVGCVQ